MIDNYDSFTFNLVHYFRALGQEVEVHRNDNITLEYIHLHQPKYIVISPGPCEPNSAGMSLAIIEAFAGKIPILGVCLGHRCIAQFFGAKIEKSRQVMHGKTSLIQHNQRGLFYGLTSPYQVTRYHSLIVNKASLPDELEITAWSCDKVGQIDEIMALQHKNLPIACVQFHPESVLTEYGHELLKNFLSLYNRINSF